LASDTTARRQWIGFSPEIETDAMAEASYLEVYVASGLASRLRLKHHCSYLGSLAHSRRQWIGFSPEIETFVTARLKPRFVVSPVDWLLA